MPSRLKTSALRLTLQNVRDAVNVLRSAPLNALTLSHLKTKLRKKDDIEKCRLFVAYINNTCYIEIVGGDFYEISGI